MNSGRAALLHGWKPTATTAATALQVICASIYPQHRDGVHVCCGSTRHHCGLAIHLCILLSNKRSQGIIPLLASDVLQWTSSEKHQSGGPHCQAQNNVQHHKESGYNSLYFFQPVSVPNISRVCPAWGIFSQLGKMHFGLRQLVTRGYEV